MQKGLSRLLKTNPRFDVFLLIIYYLLSTSTASTASYLQILLLNAYNSVPEDDDSLDFQFSGNRELNFAISRDFPDPRNFSFN